MMLTQDRTGGLHQLRQGALRALRMLDVCPLVPVDAFVYLVGLTSQSSAYQQLARLRNTGLAEVRRVDPGYLVGERRLGCWMITDKGRRMLALAACPRPFRREAIVRGGQGARGPHRSVRISQHDLPLLITTYRLLAAVVLERSARGHAVEITSFEWPWVRPWRSAADDKLLHVTVRAGVTLSAFEEGIESGPPRGQLAHVLLVPDLGTAPIARYREMLRRLVAFCDEVASGDRLAHEPVEVVIATSNPDATGARSRAWLELLAWIERRQPMDSLQVRVRTWDWVADMVKRMPTADLRARAPDRALGARSGRLHVRGPVGGHEQVLHLIGRHSCLTVHNMADLLGTRVDRIKRIQSELMAGGLLRQIEFEELPVGSGFDCEQFTKLGLPEITNKGRRTLASWLGLGPGAATRYHRFIGNGRRDRGRRWRLLRTLFHTMGVNSVFVAFAIAANTLHRAGGSDDLVEWRGAAACERKYCKPDGYGCYVRNGVAHGFFLEYDRGTESTRTYIAKFRAYYSYRDSRQADRDYNGFPTVLFVTTQARAEQRIADAASRAWFLRGREPLALLITTTSRIITEPEGILGRIWRRPGQIGATADDAHQYWLTDGRSNSLVGAERIADFARRPEFRKGLPPFKNSVESPGFSRDEFRQQQRPAADGEVAGQ
jgi:Replication-relaxation